MTFDVFSRSNVKDFVEWLRKKKYAPKTINLKLTAIRSFLKYCADEDFELRGIYNDVCTVRKVKEEKKPIEYLQPEATKAILSSYDTRTAKHRRNRMILILLYDTGARVQELSDLSVSSLHLDVPHPYVTLIGKGRKTRNVPVMNKTVAHLRKYLEEFHPDLTEAPLFYSRLNGKPHQLSTDSISLILKTAAQTARATCSEVPENVHCHLIRNPNFNKIQTFSIQLRFYQNFEC